MPRAKRRNAVLLVQPRSDFHPADVGDIPDAILSAIVQPERLHYCGALDECRRHNADQLAQGGPIRQWALLVKHVTPSKSKGGAV